ncbi:MAG: plasmid replication/partition related protein [Paucibacter sp.]|nr:plasmid replication/partition related protein [Roseateles sp.]
MEIVVDEELKAYIAPLTTEEHDALERSILAEGCRDALVLWGNVLVDGHNRYGICQKHGLPFQTVQNARFASMEDVHLWMIDQHLGRRSVSDYQRGVLALRKREIMANRRHNARAAVQTSSDLSPAVDATEVPPATPPRLPETDSLSTREALARAARLSPSQVVMIEKIQKQAAPELVEAVTAGTITINAAAAVATLPASEQVAAVLAGKDELRQAAKRVREAKRKPSVDKVEVAASSTAPDESLESLKQQVAALTAENTALRQQLTAMERALACAGLSA